MKKPKFDFQVPPGVTRLSVEQLRILQAGGTIDVAATPQGAAMSERTGFEKVASTIRLPKKKKTSEAEQHYKRILAEEFPCSRIEHGVIKFTLPSGTLYTPDLTVWEFNTLVLAVEVKGMRSKKFNFDGVSKEKFKAAIAAFPHIRWRFASLNLGNWMITNSNDGH